MANPKQELNRPNGHIQQTKHIEQKKNEKQPEILKINIRRTVLIMIKS